MRRLVAAARGGGVGFLSPYVPPDLVASGPYASSAGHSAAVLTQVHCHTTNSDGARSPATVVADYLARGFDALMLSDHDKVTAQPAGIATVITGNELSPTTQHIIGMNTTYTRGATTAAQSIIDGIVATGGLAEIAHPKWSTGISQAELAGYTDLAGFEIHNAHVVTGASQNPVTYAGYAIDWWDTELTAGRRDRWGFSVDDLHTFDANHVHDVGRLRVFVGTNTLSDVMAAIGSGNFVADVSNYGVTPGFPDRANDGVSLNCTGATRIEAYGDGGALLAAADTNALSYAYTGDETYVRLVAVGDYTEPFTSALDDRWRAFDGTWTVGSGVLTMTNDSTARTIVLRRHRDGDFEQLVDFQLPTSAGRVQVLYNLLKASSTQAYYYAVHVGKSGDGSYNDHLAVGVVQSSNFGTPFVSTPFVHTGGTFYRLRLSYTALTGRIRVKLWDRDLTEPDDWTLDGSDTTWRNGAFGFRATTSPSFDNFYVDGFRTYYQPISIDPA